MSNTEGTNESKRKTGFATMPRERVRELGRMGGLANVEGRHRFTPEEARTAGSKGGRALHAKRRAALEMAVTTGTEDETAFADVMP